MKLEKKIFGIRSNENGFYPIVNYYYKKMFSTKLIRIEHSAICHAPSEVTDDQFMDEKGHLYSKSIKNAEILRDYFCRHDTCNK